MPASTEDETRPGEAWWRVRVWIEANDGAAIRSSDHVWIKGALGVRDEDGRTPLMLAAWLGKLDAFNALLEMGARLSDMDTQGRSAQDYVRIFGQGGGEGRLRMSVRLELIERAVRLGMEQGAADGAGSPTPRRTKVPPL